MPWYLIVGERGFAIGCSCRSSFNAGLKYSFDKKNKKNFKSLKKLKND
jgi:hypothetical protein